MEFPLKPDFFPRVRLTAEDRQRYVATAEYSVHVLRKLVADDKWKRISEAKGVTVGKVHCIEEQAHGGAGAARACMILCASVTATGSVSEVLEAIASPVTDDYRRAMAFLYKDRFVDGVCLHTLSPHGSRNTQAFTTIKWAAFKGGLPSTTASIKPQHFVGMDYCFMEHSGIQREPTRDDTFGFCIQESITRNTEVPSMPGFGLARGELHRTGILVLPTDRKDTVQIASILQMDTATPLSKSALEKIMVRRVTAVERIPMLVDRRRLSRMKFLPRDDWVRDDERRACAVCTKSFGLRRKHHCRHCGEVVCATCAPPRDVDLSTYGVASIRICTACVVQARHSHAAKQKEDVLVFHVRETLSSLPGRDLGDDMENQHKLSSSSSSDSNFSISSEEQDTRRFMDQVDDDPGFDQYDNGDAYERDDSQVVSIGPGSPDALSMRYSGYSEASSSGFSFSDLNTLADDALRITSVTTAKPKASVPPAEEEHKRTLYEPQDAENRAPNRSTSQRESMDEWFAPRKQPRPLAKPPTPYQPPSIHKEYMNEWATPAVVPPPGSSHSRTSSGSSSLAHEAMDEWLAPARRRERNHSHASTGSAVSGVYDSKRSSSSEGSTNSLMEMLASIHEMKTTLAPRQQAATRAAKTATTHRQQMHKPMYMERLSELQLREAEPPVPQPQQPQQPQKHIGLPPRGAPSPNPLHSRLSRHSDLTASRGVSSSMASTVDIDLLDSDNFSLLCPETLQRQQQQRASSSQDAGERRSARASNLSTSTVLEDVDDLDSMRQSELAQLRQQVEGLHRSLEDATNKLNYFTARSMVRDQVDTLEREVLDLQQTERRHRSESETDDVVIKERKSQYHALIDELHEIMGLPALRTRPRSQELLHP